MPPDDLRSTLGLSAIAGGAVWGLYHLATTLLAGQPVHRQDILLASFNVAAAIAAGALAAWFVGPALIPLVPIAGLRDPHAIGFGIGAVAWEAAPFAYRWLRMFSASKAGGGAP
jgi:hypothetical protein